MESRRLVCIGGGLAPADVERRVPAGRIHSLLYYPYYGFLARVRARSVTYLIDARTGRLSTADPFPVESLDVPVSDVLSCSFDESHASKLAQRYIPGRVLAEKGLLHKPFWILSSDSRKYLMDAQSARIHPLPTS